ncbi:DUF6434 domain-containing protein [Lysinibacillus sp. KU-BSD001]|uniref:DUF6434 domain-containing protein n=1 Tax=Lysinibacillus sp. KU-BSD001 TaxID=3141328 RepID=UPI0036E07CDA
MRPPLTKDLNAHEFRNYYWLKEELQSFCRENGMSASGAKLELTDRIAVFLQTGEIQQPLQKRKTLSIENIATNLSLDTVITENHRCSQAVRAFFKAEIPNFHFSTYIQNYFKENVGKTYRDVVNAWYEELERQKDPAYKKVIAPQFEYNQFIQDYFADPKNSGKTRDDAITAWKEIKQLPGSNKYIAKHEE